MKKSDDEKKEVKRLYNKQTINCDICGVTFARCNKDHHEKTQKHRDKKLIYDYAKKINDLEKKVQIVQIVS